MKNLKISFCLFFSFFYQLNAVIIIVPGEAWQESADLQQGGNFYNVIEQAIGENHKIDYFEWYQAPATGILFNERVNGGLKLAQKIIDYKRNGEWEINIIAYRFGCDIVFLASIFLSSDFMQENLNNLPIKFSGDFNQNNFKDSYPYLFSRNNPQIQHINLRQLKDSCVEYMGGGFGKICNQVIWSKPWIKDFFALNYPVDFVDTVPNWKFFESIFNLYSPLDGGQFKKFNLATNIEVNIEDFCKKDDKKIDEKGNLLSSGNYEGEKKITSAFLARWLLHVPMYLGFLGEKNKNYQLTIFTDGKEPLFKIIN
ncbi:MAG: hypothetical protein ABIA74_00595 [bacterium]